MKNLRQQKAIRIVAALALTLALASFAIPAQAQTFKSLHTFGGVDGTPPDGSYPNGLVQGTNGYLAVRLATTSTGLCSKSALAGRKRSSITFGPRGP